MVEDAHTRLPKKALVAFVHIEKAAGTTLLYLLRRNFLGRYLDVRPYAQREPKGTFMADDLRVALRINPLLRAVGGHAVTPCSDLSARSARPVRYITVLREPVARYLSQFRYWNRVMGKDWSFERFLDHEPSFDLQTRKLSGGRDAGAALATLRDEFALVGTVEALDEFLVQFAAISALPFDPHYRARNTGESDRAEVDELMQKFGDEVVARNQSDLALYEQVTDVLLPEQRARYPGDSQAALAQFVARQALGGAPKVDIRLLLDAALRKGWYEPLTGWLRRRAGMPSRGSY
ncbi:MAG: hypothetical protein AAF184_07650 [Pseudomonadota bacterium]